MSEDKQRRARRFVWRDGDFEVLKPGEKPADRRVDRQLRARAAPVELGSIRRHRNLTQAEVAAALGVDQGAVSRLEARRDVHVSTLLEYLRALGLTDVEVSLTFADGEELVLPIPAGGKS